MSGTPPKVTVLMATFNGAAHLEDQVRTILDQRGVDVRLIVRDDGSIDATGALVAAIVAREPDRVVVMHDDAGPCGSAAANFCQMLRSVAVEPGAFVALADQDDVWFPDKLACAVERLRAEEADGYSSNLLAFSDEEHAAWQVRKDAPQQPFDYLFQGASAGCTYVLSARALAVVQAGVDRLGSTLPLHASHDWLVYALCRSAGLRWSMDDRARIAYRQHAANVYGTKSGLARIVERVRLLRSHWYRRAILWLATTLDLSPGERGIVVRVERLSPSDRLWLAWNAGLFRRDPREARQLRLALLTGLLR